jgi:hypothetical protein
MMAAALLVFSGAASAGLSPPQAASSANAGTMAIREVRMAGSFSWDSLGLTH